MQEKLRLRTLNVWRVLWQRNEPATLSQRRLNPKVAVVNNVVSTAIVV